MIAAPDVPVAAPDADRIPALLMKDTCDAHASGVAQAYVRVLIGMQDGRPTYLDLCASCYRRKELHLLRYPFRDQRFQLGGWYEPVPVTASTS